MGALRVEEVAKSDIGNSGGKGSGGMTTKSEMEEVGGGEEG